MPTYDFMVQEHRTTLEFVFEGTSYVAMCACGWNSPVGNKARCQGWAMHHVLEREQAVEAAREKTRYLIHEEP